MVLPPLEGEYTSLVGKAPRTSFEVAARRDLDETALSFWDESASVRMVVPSLEGAATFTVGGNSRALDETALSPCGVERASVRMGLSSCEDDTVFERVGLSSCEGDAPLSGIGLLKASCEVTASRDLDKTALSRGDESAPVRMVAPSFEGASTFTVSWMLRAPFEVAASLDFDKTALSPCEDESASVAVRMGALKELDGSFPLRG